MGDARNFTIFPDLVGMNHDVIKKDCHLIKDLRK